MHKNSKDVQKEMRYFFVYGKVKKDFFRNFDSRHFKLKPTAVLNLPFFLVFFSAPAGQVNWKIER